MGSWILVEKLRKTLLHELCHAAAWLLDFTAKPPHGTVFKRWATLASNQYKDLEVKTCHSYTIDFKYRYICTNPQCKHVHGRHSRSIDTKLNGCGKCGGILELENRRKRNPLDNGEMVPRTPSAYQSFVKEAYARVKREKQLSAHAQVMVALAEEWARLKLHPKKLALKDNSPSKHVPLDYNPS
jgi:hypothetical protein